MRMDVTFSESDQSFVPGFDEIQNVSDGGYERGYEAGSEAGYTEGYTAGEVVGIAAGRQEEYDAFWDAFQQNGERINYCFAFSQPGAWTEDTYKPKYDIRPSGSGDRIFSMYMNSLLTDIYAGGTIDVDFSGVTGSCGQVFYGSKIRYLKTVDFSNVPSLTNVFNYCSDLVTIEKLVLNEAGTQTFTNTVFGYMTALENITIEGKIGRNNVDFKRSPKLTKASITSIIHALSTTTSGLTVTLSLTAVNNAFETSKGAADGSTSAEWTALAATRSNWTISLA